MGADQIVVPIGDDGHMMPTRAAIVVVDHITDYTTGDPRLSATTATALEPIV